MRREGVGDGVLPIDKPVGPTSHDIVELARRALDPDRSLYVFDASRDSTPEVMEVEVVE